MGKKGECEEGSGELWVNVWKVGGKRRKVGEKWGKVGFGVVCNGKKWRCEGFHRDPIRDSLGMDGFHRAFPGFHGDPIRDSLGFMGSIGIP